MTTAKRHEPLVQCKILLYIAGAAPATAMIESFKHKGLARLYSHDDPKLLTAEHVGKIRLVLARLDAASTVEELDVPGHRLHALRGDYRGFWSITVRANWRIVFRFVDGNALDVELVDYH